MYNHIDVDDNVTLKDMPEQDISLHSKKVRTVVSFKITYVDLFA